MTLSHVRTVESAYHKAQDTHVDVREHTPEPTAVSLNMFVKYYDIYYRPQRSCGKVMCLHLTLILFTGGVWQTPPQADTPLGRHSPRQTTPSCGQTPPSLGRHPPRQTPHPQADIPLGRTPPLADTPSPGQTHPPPSRWPLQQMVCILLECILVLKVKYRRGI